MSKARLMRGYFSGSDFSREQDLDVDDFLARAEQFLLSSRTLPPGESSGTRLGKIDGA